MPRQPRQKSESGIYHIMLRGINKQIVFEDDEDYLKFVETLEKYKAVSGYKVFAYCLMSNQKTGGRFYCLAVKHGRASTRTIPIRSATRANFMTKLQAISISEHAITTQASEDS